MKIVQPELLVNVRQFSNSSADIGEALDTLYREHYSAILEAKRSIKNVHDTYLDLIEPVTAEIFSKVAHGRPFIADDFIGTFTQSSHWMVKTINQIHDAYVRQHRRSTLLTRLASN